MLQLPNAARTGAPEAGNERNFIVANTIEASLPEIQADHIIPVFVKDNEPLISHGDFIESAVSIAGEVFSGNTILQPGVRLSHPIKGRVPEAKNKPAAQLLDSERTVYYERMMFSVEIPTISDTIGDNPVTLALGGVKAYNVDNLNNRKGAAEHFKAFIGFRNTVCTNLCVWTDGYSSDIRVQNVGQLHAVLYSLFRSFREDHLLATLKELVQHELTEHQFATLMGRCRMYQHLLPGMKQDIPELLFGDQQLGAVCRSYYHDQSFKNDGGAITLWKLYNLFTGANKSSYIDNFLDRTVNALAFMEQIRGGLNGTHASWYLN